jgi:Bacterial Ig-like domain (group 3)
MKLNLRRAVVSASVLAIAGGVLAATASIASAATTPPWEPDSNALGSLTFYNSAGQVVTGGNNLAHLFDYAEASTADAAAGTKATLYFAAPAPGVLPANWFAGLASAASNFPNASAPPPLNTTANPVVSLQSTDADLTNFIASATTQTATGYANVYQVRLETSGPGGVGSAPNGQYWEDDIVVNPSAGTWSIEYPAVVTPTTTTLSATPSPANVGQTVTLSATEAPATAGSVQFENGGTPIGSAVAVNGSGVATTTTTFAAAGTEDLSAVFTPTDTTDYGASTGTATLTVNPPATPTAITLTVNESGTTGTDVNMSSTVTASGSPVNAGTVSWYDNGSSTPLNSTPVTPSASGVATFDIPAGLAAGAHSIVAVFTPTTVTQYESSTSAPQQFILQAPQTGACAQTGSSCTDTQNIEATVPVGTLSITTPYTASNPLNLGTLALNSTLSEYGSTPVAFGNITIVDNRAGDLPWTVTALASNLSDGGSNPGSTICGQNVGLTGISSTPGTGFTGTVTGTDNPAAGTNGIPVAAPPCTGTAGLGGTTPHTVATASAGLGTDVLNGTILLDAPTSTEAGVFSGTITFTVG